jgi:hypothetical protein
MMDTSPEYIKMCEKAKEIQELWHNIDRDENCFYAFVPEAEESSIWLPRQDQLQEMVRQTNETSPELNQRFNDHLYNLHIGEDKYSFELLWLIFVMREEYNKNWTGEEWAE